MEKFIVQTASLGLFFGLAASSFAAQPPPVHTYWMRADHLGPVLDVWRCPEQGLCAAISNVNPADAKTRSIAGFMMHKSLKELTDDDVAKLCHYQGDFAEMKETRSGAPSGSLGSWTGRFKYHSYNQAGVVDMSTSHDWSIGIEERDNGTLHLRGPRLLPFLSIDLVKVTPPPAACLAPLKP